MKSERLKITYLIDFFRTVSAGTEKQLSYLLQNLPEKQCEINLISLQKSPFLLNDAQTIFPEVSIITLDAKSDISKSFFELIRLFFLLRNIKPDIVHTFFPASNSFGVLIARMAGIKSIISSRRDMGYNLTKKDIWLLKMANYFVSSIIANAEAVKKQTLSFENVQEEKINVIYNGISSDNSNRLACDSKQETIVGIVANLNRQVKRVDLFIKAAAIVHKQFPHVKFWIIGDGPLRKGLEILAMDSGLESNVIFWGQREDVRELLSSMTVGVVSSDSEGFSNAIMEYMLAELPVIATDIGGNPELVHHGKTGILVQPNDVGALAEAFQQILNRSDTAVKMGNAAKAFISERFSIDAMVCQTHHLYQDLLSQNYQRVGEKAEHICND